LGQNNDLRNCVRLLGYFVQQSHLPACFDHLLIFVCFYGHMAVTKVLLLDSQVNPGGNQSACIRYAAEMSRAEIVELILHDGGADPSCRTRQLFPSKSQ
jgi:hypothetical protein